MSEPEKPRTQLHRVLNDSIDIGPVKPIKLKTGVQYSAMAKFAAKVSESVSTLAAEQIKIRQGQELIEKYLADVSDEELEKLIEVAKNAETERENLMSLLYTSPQPPALEPAPGFGTLRVLSFFCQKNFRERVLEPYHAEALADYYEAIDAKDLTRAKWVKRMMHVWMMWAMVGGAISWVGGMISLKIGSGE